MLQRALIVKRWLTAGYHVLMERSHVEDLIFIRHLHAEKLVTKEEHDVYVSLWEMISDRLRLPNLIIFFDPSSGGGCSAPQPCRGIRPASAGIPG